MGHRTGLKPIGNERELKNKHPGGVWRAPWEEILSAKFKRPFGPVGVAALRQLRPSQFSIFLDTLTPPRHPDAHRRCISLTDLLHSPTPKLGFHLVISGSSIVSGLYIEYIL